MNISVSFWITLLFAASGTAALIYEVVWFHLIRLAIGGSQLSITILVVSFMGGMFLGSFLFSKLVSRRYHPLLLFGIFELGIAILGLVVIKILPILTNLYFSYSHGLHGSNLIVRALLACVCLIPVTTLMGATLPAISRWGEQLKYFDIGKVYGANTLGGVFGTLLAGFFLMRFFDVHIAGYTAFAIQFFIFCVSLWLSKKHSYSNDQNFEVNLDATNQGQTEIKDTQEHLQQGCSPSSWIYWLAGLSGCSSLGAQLLWSRSLAMIFGGTVYNFTLILSIFLAGIGAGSCFGSYVAKKTSRILYWLMSCQFLLILAIAYSSWFIVQFLPEFTFLKLFQVSWLQQILNDSLRCIIALLPATFIWGVSFSLMLAFPQKMAQDPARHVGNLYAANTLGAILGCLFFGLYSVPQWGSRGSQIILIGIVTCSLLVLLVFAEKRSYFIKTIRHKILLSLSALIFAIFSMYTVPSIDPNVAVFGRFSSYGESQHKYLQVEEGVDSTIAVLEQSHKMLSINGKIVASTSSGDQRILNMLGHLPALFHPKPKSVLIIGFGTGITAGALSRYSDIEKITIVEIEKFVIDVSSKFFAEENYNVLQDPRVRVIHDDGRHFLSTTDETFDVITSDPIHPWMKGGARLFTVEFYQLCKQKLRQGGIMSQWVPFYEISEEAVKSEVATFLKVFDQGTLWNSAASLEKHRNSQTTNDTLLIGGKSRVVFDFLAAQQKLEKNPLVSRSLAHINIHSSFILAHNYAGQSHDFKKWMETAEISWDRNLRLEYLAGLSLNKQLSPRIFYKITKKLHYPKHIFVLPKSHLKEFRDKFMN